MKFLYILFIAIINNIDNIGVRIAYSLRGINIPFLKNLWISIITFFISSLTAFSGNMLSEILDKNIASIISMILFIIIGLWIIFEPYIKKHSNKYKEINSNKNIIFNILKQPESADIDNSNDINFKEATLLGIALSINNICGGLSAGMIGLNSLFVGAFSALISFIVLWIGNYITKFFNKYNIGDKAIIFSGIVLIIIGLNQVF